MPTTFHVARENHGSRNRSIAIAKLITKFQGEGDSITHVEQFKQVCATFEDVSNGDKIGAYGKVGTWYRALKNEEKDTWETLGGSSLQKVPKWSPVNQLD